MKSELEIIKRKKLNFTKVCYYSLQYNDEKVCELDKFYDKYKTDYSKSIDFIKMWIAVIGEKFGAKTRFFRPEDNSGALPPPAKEIRTLDMDYDKNKLKLRLYCIVLSEEVVILVNGGVKESFETSGSKSCWDQYMFTSNIASQINKMIGIGYLKVNGKNLEKSKNFKLNYKK